MDLVDIDQVLDNLELCEAADESRAAAAATARHLPAAQDAAVATQSNGLSSTQRNKDRSFVGVSQVFNSLDDYCNNVKSLGTANMLQQYDEECQSTVIATVNEETQPQLASDEEELEDDEVCSDIHKFREVAHHQWSACEQHDVSVSSDSLTTSSSSTFSSGPSPGALSTADENSTPLSPVAELVATENVVAPQGTEELTISEVEEEEEQQQQVQLDDSFSPPVDDLAHGLSTISLTVSSTPNSQLLLPCESNVSSALRNVLDQLSDTDSSSLLSQQPDEELKLNTNDDTKQREEKQEQPVEIKVVPAINTAPAAMVRTVQQQPITFGSTMDEISDTELDSMLQEMDVDENEVQQQTQQQQSPPQQQQPTLAKNVVINCKNDNNTKQQKLETQTVTSEETVEKADTESSDASSNLVDGTNGDSLSQASTVEFSEVRAQAQVTEASAQSQNSIASSYTSSESSSLDGEDALSADGDAHDEAQEPSATRPIRPTSLDLSAVKPNLYVNAGQTPPAATAVARATTTTATVTADATAAAAVTSASNTDNSSINPPPGVADNEVTVGATGYNDPNPNLGKVPPIWVPDNMAPHCMTCQTKFTMIKRRHHCRACGKVLCSVCCSQKYKLEFLDQPESRICIQCYLILVERQRHVEEPSNLPTLHASNESLHDEPEVHNLAVEPEVTTPARSPNPNNPMEYCSTIPPYRQVNPSAAMQPPPTVIVPVGVLKKECSYSSTSSNSSSKQQRKRKSVMFSDGIAPGSDLATLEHEQWHEGKQARNTANQQKTGNATEDSSNNKKKPSTPASGGETSAAMGIMASLFRGAMPPAAAAATVNTLQQCHEANSHNQSANNVKKPSTVVKKTDSVTTRLKRLLPTGYDVNGCFIPTGDNNKLPPIYTKKDERGNDYGYKEVVNNAALLERLQQETLNFALDKNFFVRVKIVHLKCCMNRTVINFTTCGMHFVGNDEIVILLEMINKDDLSKEPPLSKEIFEHLYEIYTNAEQGNPISELSHTSPRQNEFLGSREYGGFIFIRNTYQCLQDVIVPENPFLIGILIHRYEVPWAKVFPLRLMLRLGAQYRYYPCPHISMRNRESVYAEIAQTIINFLADFRNYSYTLPNIRGLYIHMEERRTTVIIPRNRLEDIIKAINNASDHILAFGGNFSKAADGHLVCMQNTNDEQNEMFSYSTQAINIQGQPRRVTGASFFVLNEALKSSSGLSGKCSIVEDGLMVQITPTKMEEVRNALRNHKDIDIVCGPLNATEEQTETVSIKWTEFDRDFNIGVTSVIDGRSLEGVSSVRVHASFNYSNATLTVRLAEIYIIKYDEWYNSTTSNAALPLDITRLAGQISRSVSMAMVPFLDLLVQNGIDKFALRTTLHQENVCYEAGALGEKLPPLYMNALDDQLIGTLHNESNGIEAAIILELKFYILSV